MPDFNVARAIRSNPIYARMTRWTTQFSEIAALIGGVPDGPVAFAEAIANWQSRQGGLARDGMLGPKTWRKMKRVLPAGAPRVALPGWLVPSGATGTHGWAEAVVETLREDISFLSLSRGRHSVRPADFGQIAGLIERGHITIVPTRRRKTGSYEPRNGEDDANSLKLPRRRNAPWRQIQAMIVHETTHAISDMRGRPRTIIEDEAFAFTMAGMFLERHKVPLIHDEHHLLRRAARAIGRHFLDGDEVIEAQWEALESIIRRDPGYASKDLDQVLKFDGFPGVPAEGDDP